MKAVSASAKINRRVEKLFSDNDRSLATTKEILRARSSATGQFESFGVKLTTNKSVLKLRGNKKR